MTAAQSIAAPACLYLICRLNGNDHSLDDLRKLAKTSVLGTDMLSLKETAVAVGFEVDACACSFATLCERNRSPEFRFSWQPGAAAAALIQ